MRGRAVENSIAATWSGVGKGGARQGGLAGLAWAGNGQDGEAPAQAPQSLAGLLINYNNRLTAIVQIGN